MKKFLTLLSVAVLAVSALAAPKPTGGISASVNPSGAFSFLKVDALGQLIVSPTVAAAAGPTPSGGTAIAVDPSGNFVYLSTDATGALMTTGGGGGGGGNVSSSGTPVAGQVAEWVTAGTIKGVNTTGSNNYVKSDSPVLLTPTFTTNITTPKIIFTSSVTETFGTGSPEGVVTANIASVYHRTDGGAATSLYVKESGTGNTGWSAVGGGGGGGSGTVTSVSVATANGFSGSVANATTTPAITLTLNTVFPIATIVFDGNGSAPSAGTVTNVKPVTTAYTITGYTIIGDVSGSAVVGISMATGGSSTFNSIVASAPPTLSSSRRVNSSTLTGWTTSVPANADIKGSLTSASTLTKLTVVIYGTLN